MTNLLDITATKARATADCLREFEIPVEKQREFFEETAEYVPRMVRDEYIKRGTLGAKVHGDGIFWMEGPDLSEMGAEELTDYFVYTTVESHRKSFIEKWRNEIRADSSDAAT